MNPSNTVKEVFHEVKDICILAVLTVITVTIAALTIWAFVLFGAYSAKALFQLM